MATIRAYVYKDSGTVGSDYRVFPAVVVLSKNDKFQLVNTTDHDATWTVPVDIFAKPITNDPVPKKSRSGEKIPKESLDGPIGVEYEVKVDGHTAKGNSDPVIIIDP
jgi:hypothetical protein